MVLVIYESDPRDTERSLNVGKTFGRHPAILFTPSVQGDRYFDDESYCFDWVFFIIFFL